MRRTLRDWGAVRERGAGLAFALVLNAMLLLALLTMGHMTQQPRDERELVTFDVKPQGEEKKEEEATKRSEKREEQEAAPPERAEPVVRRPPLPVPTRNPVPDPPPPLPFLTITRDEMASADIGKMPGKEKAGTEKAGTGEGSKVAAAGPGEGPGGVQLYDAEWYRRPTHAELSPYVPASAPPRGYGLVACQTIERYHVENCQILSESPPGSGLARAIRLAAWQFLVLPPRVNGKVMVGSWVRIRIDYNRVPASSASEGQEGG